MCGLELPACSMQPWHPLQHTVGGMLLLHLRPCTLWNFFFWYFLAVTITRIIFYSSSGRGQSTGVITYYGLSSAQLAQCMRYDRISRPVHGSMIPLSFPRPGYHPPPSTSARRFFLSTSICFCRHTRSRFFCEWQIGRA